MSQFEFLQLEWSDIAEAASKAEQTAIQDPRTSCFYARRALELVVHWAFKFDRALKLPYNDNVSALIHEPTFKQTAGAAVFAKAKVIVTLGNRAVHSHRAILAADSRQAVNADGAGARSCRETARLAGTCVFSCGWRRA